LSIRVQEFFGFEKRLTGIHLKRRCGSRRNWYSSWCWCQRWQRPRSRRGWSPTM